MSHIIATDFLIEVKKGLVTGHSLVHKFGRNPDIDVASNFEAIWNGGGAYTGIDAIVAETIDVFSSAAADAGTIQSSGTATGGSTTALLDTGADFVVDGVAVGDIVINDTKVDHGIVTVVAVGELTMTDMQEGSTNEASDAYRIVTPASTGLAVVRVEAGLDANYAEVSQYIVLNGTTGVDGTTALIRGARLYGVLVGSGGSNVGTITMRQKTTTANVFAVLPIGYNQTMIAAFTIPAGKTGYIIQWFASIAKKQATFSNVRLLVQHPGEPLRVQEEYTIASTGTSFAQRQFEGPKDGLRARTDIVVMADTSVDNSGVSAGFDILLIDD